MLMNFLLYILKVCNVIDDKDNYISDKEKEYKDVCDKIPNNHIHHLEDPEDYHYHPFEF